MRRFAFASYVALIPTAAALPFIDATMGAPALAVASLALPITWAAWRQKRGAWVVLMAHAGMIALTAAATAPFARDLRQILAALFAEALMAIALFAQKDVRAPFLSEGKRGARRHKRVEMKITVRMMTGGANMRSETHDVSEGGAYIVGVDPAFKVGARVTLELGSGLWVSAHIVAVYEQGAGAKPPGIAVEFSSLRSSERDALREIIAKPKPKMRTLVALPIKLEGQGMAQTAELSASGCSIVGLSLSPGDRVAVTIALHDQDELDLTAEVVRQNELQFLDVHATDHRRLRERLNEFDVCRY